MRSKSGTKMKQRTFLRERREFELARRGKVAAARYCFSKSAFGFKKNDSIRCGKLQCAFDKEIKQPKTRRWVRKNSAMNYLQQLKCSTIVSLFESIDVMDDLAYVQNGIWCAEIVSATKKNACTFPRYQNLLRARS